LGVSKSIESICKSAAITECEWTLSLCYLGPFCYFGLALMEIDIL
jgi:hypothetical protein